MSVLNYSSVYSECLSLSINIKSVLIIVCSLDFYLVFTLYSSLIFPDCTKQYHSVGGMQWE
jgi:hypothetical protein